MIAPQLEIVMDFQQTLLLDIVPTITVSMKEAGLGHGGMMTIIHVLRVHQCTPQRLVLP
jgi:hypothetical protein